MVASDRDGRLLLFEEGFGWRYPADSKMSVAEAIHSMKLRRVEAQAQGADAATGG